MKPAGHVGPRALKQSDWMWRISFEEHQSVHRSRDCRAETRCSLITVFSGHSGNVSRDGAERKTRTDMSSS